MSTQTTKVFNDAGYKTNKNQGRGQKFVLGRLKLSDMYRPKVSLTITFLMSLMLHKVCLAWFWLRLVYTDIILRIATPLMKMQLNSKHVHNILELWHFQWMNESITGDAAQVVYVTPGCGPGSRPPAAQPRIELGVETRTRPKMAEAARGPAVTLQPGACSWWW